MTSSGGMSGIREALRSSEQLINIEASNITRSQIPGSKSVRGTLQGIDTLNFGNGQTAAGQERLWRLQPQILARVGWFVLGLRPIWQSMVVVSLSSLMPKANFIIPATVLSILTIREHW